MVNIEDFSDQQLKESLLEHGVNVPVTPTTRKVCENKLKKLLASGHATPKQASQSADFSDGGGVSYLNVYSSINSIFKAYRRNVFSEERQSSRNNVSELSDQSDNEGEVSARNLSKHERQQFHSRSQEKQAGSSIWKYVGIAILFLIFISFIVFLNRNAQQIGDEI